MEEQCPANVPIDEQVEVSSTDSEVQFNHDAKFRIVKEKFFETQQEIEEMWLVAQNNLRQAEEHKKRLSELLEKQQQWLSANDNHLHMVESGFQKAEPQQQQKVYRKPLPLTPPQRAMSPTSLESVQPVITQSAQPQLQPMLTKIGSFAGSQDESGAAYLKRFEILAKRMRWSPEDKYLEFVSRLRGQASQWFNGITGRTADDYNLLVEAFVEQFAPAKGISTTHMIKTLNQKALESVQDYTSRFKRVCREGGIDPNSEFGKDLFVDGLLPHLQMHARAMEDITHNIEELVIFVSKIALVAAKTEGKHQDRQQATAKKPIKCHHCGKQGHMEHECKLKASKKCAYCHKIGHLEEECNIKAREQKQPPKQPEQQPNANKQGARHKND